MKWIAILVPVLASFIACSPRDEFPTLVVGEDFNDSNLRILSIDTFDLEMSTFKFDSIITSSTGRLLLGGYKDALIGDWNSQIFLEMGAFNFTIPDEAELDSVAFVLGYDRYFYNDTSKISKISLHKVTETIRSDDENLYNTTNFEYSNEPIASKTFFPKPKGEDSIHMSLPLQFGQEIFDRIQNKIIIDNNEFTNFLKGVTIVPHLEETHSVVGISIDPQETYIRFFYNVVGEFGKEELTYDIIINPSSIDPPYFNKISSHLAGTNLEPILNDQEINISSTETSNTSFIVSGTGIATRIQLPSIKNLYDVPGTGTVLSGQLLLKPKAGTYDELKFLRDSLVVRIVDQNNTELPGSHNGSIGNLTHKNSEFNDEIYDIPIGYYIERKLNEEFSVDDALVLFPEGFNRAADRTILHGENSNEYQAKLVITYAIYDPE